MGICESKNNQQQQTPNLTNPANQTNIINNSTGGNNIDLSKIPERFLGSNSNQNNNQSGGFLSSLTGSNQNNNQSGGFLNSITGSNPNNNQSGGFLNSLTGSNQNNTQSNGLFGNILGNNTQNNANATNQDTMTKVINLGIENKDVIINGAKQILGKK
jgi:hypothetical protein